MPSQVWGRDPQEAFEEPYEYRVQEQFAREAGALLADLYRVLNSDRFRYPVKIQSQAKAVWLLAMDTLDSLRDCLTALDRKEHRIAGKLFRDVMESMDLAVYFHSETPKSISALQQWYADEIVPHREYRDYVKQTEDIEAAKRLAKHYSSLSRFTHRSYHAILDGYSVGGGDRLIHDRTGELHGNSDSAATFLVLPQTIASYYAGLANLVLDYASELSELGLVSQEEVQAHFEEILEPETVQRRFFPRRWLAERLSRSTAEQPEGQ
ncbi:MAG: hypothetical protein U0236_04580 [Nitrospira sp.]